MQKNFFKRLVEGITSFIILENKPIENSLEVVKAEPPETIKSKDITLKKQKVSKKKKPTSQEIRKIVEKVVNESKTKKPSKKNKAKKESIAKRKNKI